MKVGKQLSFYDSLFETINFEREILRAGPIEQIFKGDMRPVFADLLSSYEMSRLLFLNQAGLSFLEFPSATHNRFSHSIGCWYIGVKALESVEVRIEQFGERQERGLKRWLNAYGKVFEFLIALLLHDCGHGPFSHVLESNPVVGFDHKNISGELVMGEGPFADAAKGKVDGLHTIASVLEKYKLDRKFIAGLISSSGDEFEKDFPDFVAVKELIDGRIDIDRIDHYCRDSKNMGIKLADFNIQAFLENIVLCPGEPQSIFVKTEGIPHILNMLYSKELIWEIALDRPSVRAYEAMLSKAVSIAVGEGEIDAVKLAFYTDGELFHHLASCKNEVVRGLYRRLFSRQPYQYLGKTNVSPGVRRQRIEADVEKVVRGSDMKDHELLMHIPFEDKPKEPNFWLRIGTEDGIELGDKHPGFNRAIWDKDAERSRTIKFFAHDEEMGKKIGPTIGKYFKLDTSI